MYAVSSVLLISFVVTSVRSYPGLWSGAPLNPVHGLYVKPSGDGSKGDLFVAATEENGAKSEWRVDQPVSFLPATTTQQQVTTLPGPFSSLATSDDNSKQSLATPGPIPSPPVQYAYVLPVLPGEHNPTAPYTYAYPVQVSPTESSPTKCGSSSSVVTHYPYQYPYHMFYPQMMSAYTNAMSILKDAGLSDDSVNSVMAHHASGMWPYGYPTYVLVDPSSWSQNQSTTTSTPSTSTPSPDTSEEEITES